MREIIKKEIRKHEEKIVDDKNRPTETELRPIAMTDVSYVTVRLCNQSFREVPKNFSLVNS